VVSQVRKSKQNLIASFKTKTVTPFAVVVVVVVAVVVAVVVVVEVTTTSSFIGKDKHIQKFYCFSLYEYLEKCSLQLRYGLSLHFRLNYDIVIILTNVNTSNKLNSF